ncbi:hypothetical protein P171DRAFT_461041 [Karstenula rhodostoma CBS 690.94]|uniref:DUF7918 domain-containing protein n=1 Tax=Karstenula rhodostoma CBS 690.94 TaxID=1392251 RepID=A0A9P4PWC3_9PLEO|nr:hypothetical protein P171DRAFT_461041 [Karstenula rhodostoma CBS 690.94]
MPVYRSISIKLHSQFDIETFPEYVPRPRSHYLSRGVPTPAHTPPFDDAATSTCSVYIRAFPSSQFWLSYAVFPPVPAEQHFLFKLYVDGAHVVSWSTGKEEGWKGKTMFALFEVEDEEGRKRVEKRVLCFAKGDGTGDRGGVEGCFDEKTCLEVRVHRALGRKRVQRQVEEHRATEHGSDERGIRRSSLVNAGLAGSGHPKRFYKFALVDPVDKPYVTFRYYYRTREQIREMGLSEDEVVEDGESNELSVIEPCNTDDRLSDEAEVGKVAHIQARYDGANVPPGNPHKTCMSTGSPSIRVGWLSNPSDEHDPATSRLGLGRALSDYRLAVPPSCTFDPPQPSQRALCTLPQKRDPAADTSYQPHPIYPIDEWERKTPSPVQSLRATISTPTFGRSTKSRLTPTGWLNAVADAWRRRATPSSDDGSRTASRNDSRGVR